MIRLTMRPAEPRNPRVANMSGYQKGPRKPHNWRTRLTKTPIEADWSGWQSIQSLPLLISGFFENEYRDRGMRGKWTYR